MSSTTRRDDDAQRRKDYELLDPRRIEQIVAKRDKAARELEEAKRELRETLEAHKRVAQASGLFPTQRSMGIEETTVMPAVQRASVQF